LTTPHYTTTAMLPALRLFARATNQHLIQLLLSLCRFSGKAVCDKCSPLRSTICSMGFELPVRVCAAVAAQLTEEDKKPRARKFFIFVFNPF
jgi:hypothetical protein